MIPMDTNKNNNNSSKEAKAYLPPAEDVILKFMNKRAYKGTFIDFGCNDGYFTFTSEKFFTNVIGVDLSIDTINELLRTRPESSDAKFIRSHNYTTALPDGSADVIFMFHMLKKIPNVKQFVKEIKRLLKEDGELWILEIEKTEADLGLKASDDYFIPKEELITRLKDDELHFIEYIDINESYYGVKFTKNEDLFMRFYREA